MFDLMSEQLPVMSIRSWAYYELVPPAITPIDINDVKSHVRIDWLNDLEENYLKILIIAATKYAENYMNRRLITATWRTYRDDFTTETIIELQRNPFQSLVSFTYYDTNNVVVDITSQLNTMYYITNEPNGYSQIIPCPDSNFPSDSEVRQRQQSVIIDFKVGYGTKKEDVPDVIRMAILQHVAFMYANRGDSDVAGTTIGGNDISASSLIAAPNVSALIYNQYKIRDLATNVVVRQYNNAW